MSGARQAAAEARQRRARALRDARSWAQQRADEHAAARAAGEHLLSGFGGGPTDIPSCVDCGAVAPDPGSKCPVNSPGNRAGSTPNK